MTIKPQDYITEPPSIILNSLLHINREQRERQSEEEKEKPSRYKNINVMNKT